MKITGINPEMLTPRGSQGLEGASSKEDFGNLIDQMVNEVNKMQQDSDRKISNSLVGKEDLHEAMLSLEKANLGLKLLLQVRNKIIQAYEELSRMPL